MKKGSVTYKEHFCDELVAHLSDGFSFESFGGVIGCSRAALYQWLESHPEFKEAKEVGYCKSLLWWESRGKGALVIEKGETFNSVVWAMTMKNRFGYRDKFEDDPPDKIINQTLNLTVDDLRTATRKTGTERLLAKK